MGLFTSRRSGPPVTVADGERLLAAAALTDGRAVGGTRAALYLPSSEETSGWERVAWEEVQDGAWDREEGCLVVTRAGGAVHRLALEDPVRFLQLFRERVTNSVVLQRHVPIQGRRGVRVVVRRRSDDDALVLTHHLDAGLDPDDRVVAAAVEAARAALADEVGLSG